mmetsp:Transcript_6329/g.19859  ORF Transcript_6329/g.19859 Transcript_6329/m.19859 type:complete len:211 (+) Transcript_6329:399-1031(+)
MRKFGKGATRVTSTCAPCRRHTHRFGSKWTCSSDSFQAQIGPCISMRMPCLSRCPRGSKRWFLRWPARRQTCSSWAARSFSTARTSWSTRCAPVCSRCATPPAAGGSYVVGLHFAIRTICGATRVRSTTRCLKCTCGTMRLGLLGQRLRLGTRRPTTALRPPACARTGASAGNPPIFAAWATRCAPFAIARSWTCARNGRWRGRANSASI